MIRFIYVPNENSFDSSNLQVEIKLHDDSTLPELFCNFIELTRIIGYQPNSWDNVIKDIEEAKVSAKEYTIFDYALDNLIQ